MKTLIYIISALGVLLLFGFILEQILRRKQFEELKKNQTFMEVNKHKLQYLKKGIGNCTVVFESGLGSDLTIWKAIQDSLAQNAVTISYNRAGVTLSEPSNSLLTNESVNNDLSELLEKTACPKPYVVVGHSMGGIYLRRFIKKNEHNIGGIVFVDAAHPLQMKMASEKLLKSVSVPPVWLIKFLMNTGLYRLIFSYVGFPPEVPAKHPINIQQKRFFYLSFNETMKEAKNDKVNFEEAEQYNNYGNIPFAVITGTSSIRTKGISDEVIREEYQDLVSRLQEDFLKLSTNSWLVKAEKSGHVTQASEPQLIVNEIRKVINRRHVEK
ncbi:alpha/beta hydrolase [Pedobacter aquatilis]|uniref:alpha/beta hydrolase n=1 Tax=Pedobacter aquatilis TaxID=351343 RepID=UPI00292F2FE2|nr:alpha/beta hydrolase [Pedobacter aquatilis]